MINFFRNNLFLILFFFVLIIGCFFRFYNVTSVPFGLNNDAAWEGSAAIEILKGNVSPYLPYAAEGWRGEGIARLFVAFFMVIIGNNPLAIRLSTEIFGVGLVITSFLLINHLFGKKLALVTSFFIAISGWHITMSKTGWRAVTVPFFTSLIFYFLFKGLKTKKLFFFLLSGISLSILTFYTYDAARIVPFFFIFWLFIEGLTRKHLLRNYWKQLVFLLTSFFIVGIPMINYAINNWLNFTSRSDFLFIGHQIQQARSFLPLWNNFLTSALLFNYRANGNDFFIFDPLLDNPVAILFPIGFFLTLFFIIFKKNKKNLFMLLYFLTGIIPGILSTPNGNRAIGAILPVYFLTAVGLVYPLVWITKFLKLKRYFFYILVVLFCSYSTYVTYNNYLGPSRKELVGFYPETLVTTNYIKKIWKDYDIYLTDNYPRELLTYYLYRPGQNNAFDKNYVWVESTSIFLEIADKNLLKENNAKKGLAFFMFDSIENEEAADLLLKKFPTGKRIYLWYNNDNIHRPASLVVEIPKT